MKRMNIKNRHVFAIKCIKINNNRMVEWGNFSFKLRETRKQPSFLYNCHKIVPDEKAI